MMRIFALLVALLMIGLTTAPTAVARDDPVSTARDLALAIVEEAQKPGGGELTSPEWWIRHLPPLPNTVGTLCIIGNPWRTVLDYVEDPGRPLAVGTILLVETVARAGGYTDGAPQAPSLKTLQVVVMLYGGACGDGQDSGGAVVAIEGGEPFISDGWGAWALR